MSRFGRIFWNNYDFIYVSIIFIDSLACDGYKEIRNTVQHFSDIHISEIFFFSFFLFLLKTISSMNCQDVKHEMSKLLPGNISKCHLLDVDKAQSKICSRRLSFGLDFHSKKNLDIPCESFLLAEDFRLMPIKVGKTYFFSERY